MNYWFISDFHFGHKNVLKYDNRPFKNIEEHDESIIKIFNGTVCSEDDVFYLGDFALCGSSHMSDCIHQLRGNLHFIRGNHDKHQTIKLYEKFGKYLGEQATIRIENQQIVLNHCRLFVWEGSHRGTWNIHGHSHGNLDNVPWGKSIDVSANNIDYRPIEFYEIKNRLDKIQPKIVDHHEERS
jgi:calcineurin-like phosphoesterase family protein